MSTSYIKLFCLVLIASGALSVSLSGQASFSEPIPNPDGIKIAPHEYFTRPEFHDLGNDGDGDILLTYFDTTQGSFNSVSYFQNFGTAQENVYDSLNVKEIIGPAFSFINQFSYGDLNNDGTIDALQLFLLERQNGPEWEFVFYSNDSEDSLNLSSTPVFNPFQLDRYTSMKFFSFINLVDFDNDEDLDLMISEFTGNVVFPPEFDMVYMQNVGSPDTPEFSTPQDVLLDPTGVSLVLLPSFGDMDGDGDMDMLGINVVDEGLITFSYFENTTTTDIPEFTNAIKSPFGLDSIFSDGIVTPTLYDYDHDGDLDLFVTSDSDISPKTLLYLNESVSKVELADFQQAGLKAYPNPATERIQVTFQNPTYGHLMIYDLEGKIILHRLIKGSQQQTIDVSHLLPGSYILYYEDQKQKASEKIIVR